MIEVKIYCIKTHKDYQTSYDVINNVLLKNKKTYIINRITKSDFIRHRNISAMPYIVINNIVVHQGSCPTEHEIKLILIRMKLL
jgi:hypothetical protein